MVLYAGIDLHSTNSSGGGPEPIIVTLTAGGANHVDCWSLCETGIEEVEPGSDPLSGNLVASVAETSSGVYELLLDRPISAGHWSTVTFFGDGSEVSDAVVVFFVTTNPSGAEAESDAIKAAAANTEFYVEHYSDAERIALADILEDSNLTFAGALGASAAATAAETLRP